MRRIEDYAFIGDTRSAALVSLDGSIDWLCLPRFDSPACFAALLEPSKGGSWRISPSVETAEITRRYRDESLVLETTFETRTGRATLLDCLAVREASDPQAPRSVRAEHVLARVLTGVSGSVPITMEFAPRFDYGRIAPWFRKHDYAVEAVAGPDALDLVSDAELRSGEESVRADFEIREGETAYFLASYHPSHIPGELWHPKDCQRLLQTTQDFWESWAKTCTYAGRWREPVIRSLMTLKGLTYAPTGGVVAAPTTSLPERIGGARNWDYRYCWLRDATFTLDVLVDRGYTSEAIEWRDWLLRAVAGDAQDLQIMYGVMGERRLHEVELDWLSGYEGSKPVRIGNDAYRQFQLDVYGELIDSLYSARRAGIDASDDAWELQRELVEYVCQHWRDPDEGIWEPRSGRRHYVHSKVMAWVAVDRAIKSIEEFGRRGPVEHWRSARQQIRDDVMERGINESRGCFRRAYDDDEVDAALLVLPLVGFIDADEEVMRATIEAVEQDLVQDGLVLRYRTHAVRDGLAPGEGPFLICTFWLIDCLILVGREGDALKMFERLLEIRNDVGLLAEQYDPVERRFLGNFPQAFSHVGLVTSAVALESHGKARAVTRGRSEDTEPKHRGL